MGSGGGDLTKVSGFYVTFSERWAGDRHGKDYVAYLQRKLRDIDSRRARIVAEIERASPSESEVHK